MTTPRRGRATLASALCMAAGMSAVFMGSFPVFLGAVSKELGWGRATFPQCITIASITAALLMPLSGRLVDRVGVRWPVFAGLLLVATGMVLLSFLSTTGLLLWPAALCIGVGSSLSGPPAFVGLISSWYDRNRALALACVLSVAPACGQAIVAPLTQHMMAAIGWRDAYRGLAVVTAAAALVAAAGFLRPSARAPAPPLAGGAAASAGEALRTWTFWLLATASCLGGGAVLGLMVHVVAWQTGRGVPPEAAALVLSVLFVGGIAGAFLAGYAADRTRNIHILQAFYALPLVGLGAMAAGAAIPSLMTGALLIGMAMGATTSLTPFLVTRYFGLKSSAEIFGLIMAMTMIAFGLAPMLIGIGYDATGGYAWPLATAAAAMVIAMLSVGLLDWAARTQGPPSAIGAARVMVQE